MDKQEKVEQSVLELLLESSKAITSELDLEKLVQRVTDVGTELTNAAFGAFFYNKENKAGEKYLLYTISGVAKEAFSKFPMPRNTKIFNPTFTGQGVIRYDDVTAEAHYGQSAPYHGMPKGHLPVRSYLAAPVISSLNNEVIGGLFFGHPEPAVFTKETEKLIEGIAAQAAIAMTNARLFEEKKQTEKILLERSEQYKNIFETTFDSILILDMKGIVVEMNQAAEQLFGYQGSSLLQKHGEMLFHDRAQFESVRDFVKSGRKYTGGVTIRTSRMSEVNVEITATSFAYGDQPHILAVLSTIPDKLSRQALEEIREFSEVITNAAPVGLWMTDKDGDTIYVNQTWIDWTGKSMSEHVGNKWVSFVLPEDQDIVLSGLRKAFQDQKLLEIEFRVKRKDAKVIWCLLNGNPYYSKDGVYQGYAGFCMDITERKEAQEKLSMQNVLFHTITNNTLQGLLLMDDRQHCTYMNPAAEKITGYKLNEVLDKPLHYYVHHTRPDGRHFPIEECAIDRALPTMMQTQGEDVFIRKDGDFYNVSFIASPIIENGAPKGTVIEIRDTTKEKEAEAESKRKEAASMELLEQKVKERTAELEKMNYELMQFTSVASHDLKEPLRKISVFSKLLKTKAQHVQDETFQKHLENIVQSAGRMTRLIEDLLLFSRLSQNNLIFNPVDLNTLLTQIVSDLEISIKEKNATITIKNDLPIVLGISLQLGQVFQNLISNSLKFAHPQRDPVINIMSETIDRRGERFFRVLYEDNGIGFNNQHAEKIFDIFQRLHTKDKYEGTGIGLAIVKKIISLHKGEIRAHGVENEGSSFEILLPSF